MLLARAKNFEMRGWGKIVAVGCTRAPTPPPSVEPRPLRVVCLATFWSRPLAVPLASPAAAVLHPRRPAPLRCCTRLPAVPWRPLAPCLVPPDPAAVLRAAAACCVLRLVADHPASDACTTPRHVTAVGARAAHQVVEVATAIAQPGWSPSIRCASRPSGDDRRPDRGKVRV